MLHRVAPLLLLLLLAACQNGGPTDDREHVVIQGETFKLELALTQPARNHGLMGRTSLEPDGGMLFVFPEASYQSFWMKDCLIDIDLIFLDPRGRITALHSMKAIPPRRDTESEFEYEDRARRESSYGSSFPAQFAIELKAGTLDRLDLKVQDKIELDLQRLKDRAR